MHQGLVSLLRILFRWGLLQQKALPAAAIYPKLILARELKYGALIRWSTPLLRAAYW